MSVSPTTTTLAGVYPAKVYAVNDPSNRGRIQMLIPQIYGANPAKLWAPSLAAGAAVPNVGDVVWCIFQGGDPSYPTYIPPSGRAAGYASLTGAGQTTTPGKLTQTGGFFVTDNIFVGMVVNTNGAFQVSSTGGNFISLAASGNGYMQLSADAGITIGDSGSGGITIQESNGNILIENTSTFGGQIQLSSSSTGGISISIATGSNINIQGLPTTNPGGSGNVWNSGGVLHIT